MVQLVTLFAVIQPSVPEAPVIFRVHNIADNRVLLYHLQKQSHICFVQTSFRSESLERSSDEYWAVDD